jgi:hypothetical protein
MSGIGGLGNGAAIVVMANEAVEKVFSYSNRIATQIGGHPRPAAIGR